MTRTFTVYCSEESLRPLITAAADLAVDLEKRKPYISESSYESIAVRMALLDAAIVLLLERVPE